MANFIYRSGVYALAGSALLLLSYFSLAGVGNSLSTKPDDGSSAAFTPGYVISIGDLDADHAIAAQQAKDFLDQQAAGNRALLSLDIYQRFSSNPADVLRDGLDNPLGYTSGSDFIAYPGLWWDAGQAEVANLIGGYFAALLAADADVDAALVVGQFPLSLAQIKARAQALDGEQNYFEALLSDPRFAAVQADLGGVSAGQLVDAQTDSDLARRWDAYFRQQMAQRLRTAVLQPMRVYYPDIQFSALGFYHGLSGSDADVAGSHQARLLNASTDEDGVFVALREMLNQARQLRLSSNLPVHLLFADNEFVEELIYHLNLTNADRLVFINDDATEAGNQNAAMAQLDAELKLTSHSDSDYTPVFDSLARMDRDYLLSVADTTLGRVWRYTPNLAEGEEVADRLISYSPATFTNQGMTVTLPGVAAEPQAGDMGVWVSQDAPTTLACPELAPGEYCITRFTQDGHPDQPALMEQGSVPTLANQGSSEVLFDEDWGNGGPDAGVGADGFVTRWQSKLALPSGVYRFAINADDRMRLSVGGTLVLDHWQGAADARQETVDLTLAQGEHEVVLEYQDVALDAAVALAITRLACVAEDGALCVEYWSGDELVGFGELAVPQDPDANGLQFDISNLPEGLNPEGLLMQWRMHADFQRGLHQFNIAHGPDQLNVRLDGVALYSANDGANQAAVQKVIDPAGSYLVEVDYQLTAGSQLDLNWELLQEYMASCDADNLPNNAFCAEYYANRNLTDAPVFAREETQINYNWGQGSPSENMPNNNFSARWQGVWDFPQVGAYNFYTLTDDGVRLWVDDRLVIDRWRNQAPTRLERGIWLEPGQYQVKMEYYEAGGGAVAEMGWTPVTGCENVPENLFCGLFFNQQALAGDPIAEVETQEIQFDWGRGAPFENGPTNQFSARWVGDFDFAGGDYNLNVNTDDGVRIWIADQLVLDSWDRGINSLETFSVSEGRHRVVVEYREHSGNARAQVAWSEAQPCAEIPFGNFCGEYHLGRELAGFPVHSRTDEVIDFEWGRASPVPDVIPTDNFSVRWRGRFEFAAGEYRFIARTDDGMRIWLDGEEIISSWKPQGATEYFADVQVSEGEHEITVEYKEHGGHAVAQVRWERNYSCEEVPQNAFCGEFFPNKTLSGEPARGLVSPEIDFDWGNSRPLHGVNRDNFSVRWQGRFDFAGGVYRLHTDSDDGIRVWVDDELVLDNWDRAWPWGARYRQAHRLDAGEHLVRVEYREHGGAAKAKFWWEKIAGCDEVPTGSFCGEYFPNRDLQGNPKDIRNDAQIDFNWTGGQPTEAIWKDNFSVRWLGDFDFAAGGYEFTARGDDGIRVWVGDQLIIDRWTYRNADYRAIVNLTAGTHRVKVEQFEAGGHAGANLAWQAAPACDQVPDGSFCASYSHTDNGELFPVAVEQVGAIDFDWGHNSPVPGVVDSNRFETTWRGHVNFAGGMHRFMAEVDDAMEVRLNGELLFNFSTAAPHRGKYHELHMVPAGRHLLEVKHTEGWGAAKAKLSWGPSADCSTVPNGQFCVSYFNNANLQGNPNDMVMADSVSMDAGNNSPLQGINKDQFSARWVGRFNFAAATYQFDVNVDNGMRVYVDDELVIDRWQNHGQHRRLFPVTAGEHVVKVEYREAWGNAKANLTWEAVPDCTDAPTGQFCAQYFANRNLEGEPLKVRLDPTIDFSWSGGSPDQMIPSNNFSARWQGRFQFDGGAYRFHTDSDDGIRVWIGDELVLDNWNRAWPWYARYRQAHRLEAGEHLVRVEYREQWGAAKAKFWWEKISGCDEVPTGSFCGEYFPNKHLEGNPKDIRNDAQIDFNWTGGQPTEAIWKDNFSVRWLGDFDFAAGGYEFVARGDDGIRVWVDDQLIIDRWAYRNTEYRAIVNLVGGTHRIKVEQFEAGGGARANLSWQAAPACDQVPDGSFCASYSHTDNGELFPVAVEQVDVIDFDWGHNSPVPGVVDGNRFETTWKGHVNFAGGMHRFMAEVDDAMDVRLNGEPLFNFSTAAPHRGKYHALHDIPAGRHLLEVKHTEGWGSAKAKLSWEPSADCSAVPDGQFCVSYFNNANLQGDPSDMVMADSVSMDAGNNSPLQGISRDQFSARWIGRFNFAAATYRFDVDVDDGLRVYVDDELVIDRWSNRGSYRHLIPITAGEHVLKVEYREAWGNAKANLAWEAVPDCTDAPVGQFCAEYFANRDLAGEPVEIRLDPTIDFNWGGGSPGLGIPSNNFSTRWVGDFTFEAGVYDFTTRTDDGVRLWVGDNLIIDKWRPQAPTTYTNRIFLPGGTHLVKMEYYERGGGAVAELGWQALVTGQPVAPEGLLVQALDQSQVVLVWESDEFASAYRIYRNGEVLADVATPEYTDQQVEVLQTYGYQVSTVWPDGTESDPATIEVTILDTEAPTRPNGLSAQPIDALVRLTWNESTDNVAVSAYQVMRNGQLLATVTGVSHDDASVDNAAQYNYQVIALDVAGNASSASLSVTVSSHDNLAPVAPLTPVADQVSSNSVLLNWQAAQDNVGVVHYVVVRDGVEIAMVNGPTRYADQGLSGNQAYLYRIIAVDAAGNRSDASPGLSIQTNDGMDPTQPGNLQAQRVGDQGVSLSWMASTDDVGVTGYRVMRDGRLLATALLTEFTDHGVEFGNSYIYTVRALDDQGNLSPESNAAEVVFSDVCDADQQYFRVSLEPDLTQCSSCHSASGIAQNTRFILTNGANASERNMATLQNIAAILGNQTVLDKTIGAVAHGGGAPFGSAESAGYQAMASFFQRLDDFNTCDNITPANNLSVDALVMNCASCHGTDGVSAGPAIPHIAGMDAAYFAKAMRDYRDGVRYSVIMDRVAKGYSDEQFVQMAGYFASLPYQGSAQNTDAALVAEGEALHEQHCSSCHQNQGRGLDVAGVNLAGQWEPYIEATLKDYVHQRSVAPVLMQTQLGAVHGASGDQALTALAAFYASRGADTQAPETPEQPELAAILEDGVTLTWMDGDDDWGVAYYEIYRNGELIGTTEWNTFTDLGLVLGTYHYEILAVDVAGNRSEVSGGLSVQLEQQDVTPNALQLLDEHQTLRKASLILLGRTPTAEESSAVDSEETLRQTLRQMMAGDTLQDFAYRAGHEIFLVQGARGVDRNNGFSDRDFPSINGLSGAQRRDLDWAVRQQPVALLTHIVNNDLSWAEMLTADYTMVNPVMAQVTQAELTGAGFSGEDDAREMRPARIPRVSARIDQPYPHAGVLSTTAWLSRFPTTATNRNRHRAAMLLKQFMGVDLETLGQRPLDDSANGDYLVPTMENPNCLLCHATMEPISGGFMHWGENNRYLQNHNGQQGDFDSLNSAYKGQDYALDHGGYPWYQPGDRWYRDMLAPGFESKLAPDGYRGIGGGNSSITDNLLLNPGAESGTESWTVEAGELLAIPAQSCDQGQTPEAHAGSSLFMVGGCDNTSNSLAYQDIDLTVYQGAISQGQAQAVYGAFMRNWSAWNDRPSVYLSFLDAAGNMISATNQLNHRQPYWRFLRRTVDVPANAATLRFYLRGQRSGQGQLDAYVDEAVVKLVLPAETENSGLSGNLQWLAGELVQDPRYAKGGVYFWYRALFKREPLQAPLNSYEADYTEALAAFNKQDVLLEQLAEHFAQDHGNGALNVKDLLVELVLSPLFRVTANQGLDAAEVSRYADWGVSRLLTPEELNRKLRALTNTYWWHFEQDRVWNSQMGLFYGGFDGGRFQTQPNQEMNSLMNTIPDRMFMELSCNMVRDDFRRDAGERFLFPLVESTDTPVSNDGLQGVNNLLVNPGAEQGMLAWNIEQGTVRGWSNEYLNDSRGHCRGPGSANGEHYFSVGGICDQQTQNASAWQEVDVGQHANDIDAGVAQAFFGASIRPWSRNNDLVTVHLTFHDEHGDLLGESGELTHQTSQWRTMNSYVTIPAQTRRIRFVMASQRLSGTNNDGYVDDAVLSISTSAYRVSTEGEQRIRENLQYLHKHLLDEQLSLDDPEIDRSYNLFLDVWDDRENTVDNLQCSLHQWEDPNYIKRSWAAVMIYLLGDARFLYE